MNRAAPLLITDITMGVPDFPDMLGDAEKAGFDGVTICFAYQKARDAGWSDTAIKAAVDDSPLQVHGVDGLMGWAGPDDPGPPYLGEPDASGVWQAAAVLGADWVGMLVMGDPDAPAEWMAEAVAATADEAAAQGLSVFVEFTARSALRTAAKTCEVLELANRPNAFMTLDVWHHHFSGHDDADLEAMARHVGVVQLSDGPADTGGPPPTFSRVPPGAGIFPLVEDLAALQRGGFAGPIAVEVLNDGLLAEHGRLGLAERLAAVSRF